MARTIKRGELWRLKYRESPYMRGLSLAELNQRFADIISNTTTLSDDGKLAMDNTGEWLEKFTHITEEYAARGSGLPHRDSILAQLQIPNSSGLQLARALKSRLPNGLPETFTLFKYGKREFLDPLLHLGKLRLFPASRYSDPSLNYTVRDSELEFENISGHRRVTYRAKSDFYCFCSSWLPNNRLVADFEADSVLIVHDPHKFFLRLRESFDQPDCEAQFNRVEYVDPLLLGENKHVTGLAFLKHMRFAYQFEHRFVIYPSTPVAKLQYRDLNLGSLSDIAELCGG